MATKKKSKKKAKPTAKGFGRPTRYIKAYDKMVFELALLGLTDVEMSRVLDVTEKTFNNWKEKHPDFFQSLKDGKEKADAEVVAKLRERAMGYTHKEVKVFCHNGNIVTYEVDKHYPPDPTSMIFWLKNRQRGRWRDRHDINVDLENELIEKILAMFPDEYSEAIRGELEKLKT